MYNPNYVTLHDIRFAKMCGLSDVWRKEWSGRNGVHTAVKWAPQCTGWYLWRITLRLLVTHQMLLGWIGATILSGDFVAVGLNLQPAVTPTAGAGMLSGMCRPSSSCATRCTIVLALALSRRPGHTHPQASRGCKCKRPIRRGDFSLK